MIEDKYIPIIGLEIHVELKTNSKMFCGCKNDPFGAPKPNIYTCPVCLGLPGALPVPNRKAVEWSLMLGLALNCKVPEMSKFDRKHYFYPDLPKGFQISQYDQPLAVDGLLKLKIEKEKKIGITRVHLEEDTGKLLHSSINGKKVTLVDFNRSGVPLMEIVTEPDIRSSEEARLFLKKLHRIIRYLGIADADMEKGSLRIEPNVSILKISNDKFLIPKQAPIPNDQLPKYKVEIKNINSFNFVKKAIDYEIKRQIKILEKGELPKQETRGWDERKNVTMPQRSKEEAQDYRYFPEPDIPPMKWKKSQISNLKSFIPELADEKRQRFAKEYGLSEYDSTILTDERQVADYFEQAIKRHKTRPQADNKRVNTKTIANWIINKKADIAKVSPDDLVKMIFEKSQVKQIDTPELEKLIQKVLVENKKAVSDYKSGKESAIMFLMGQVMRLSKGKADATTTRQILKSKLQ